MIPYAIDETRTESVKVQQKILKIIQFQRRRTKSTKSQRDTYNNTIKDQFKLIETMYIHKPETFPIQRGCSRENHPFMDT